MLCLHKSSWLSTKACKLRIGKILLGGVLIVFTNTIRADSPLKELSTQFAMKADKPPLMDGRLDDECWKRAPAYSIYKTRASKDPLKEGAAQKTVLKTVWTDKGIFFGVENFEKNIDNLKGATTLRDGEKIWADDSNEFYIDPTGTGATFYKFDVNCVGAIGDVWQVDMGFLDKNWSANSARAVCGKTKDAWIMEFFIGWDDFKKEPKVGDVWFLIHRRLAWASGSLEDSSSTGGNFFNKIFGYLMFIDKDIPSAKALEKKLLSIVAPAWVTPYKNEWIWAEGPGKTSIAPEAKIIDEMREQAQKALYEIPKSSSKGVESKVERLKKMFVDVKSKKGFEAMLALMTIKNDAEKISDEMKLLELMSGE